MEDSSDEENQYETAEDITSASDSDSQGEGDQSPSKEHIDKARKPPIGAASRSRYALWRDHPRTIKERRQELLQLMGLQDDREYRNEGRRSESSSGVAAELDRKGINKAECPRSTSVSLPAASISSSSSSSSERLLPWKISVPKITSAFSSASGECDKDDLSWSAAGGRSGRNKQWPGNFDSVSAAISDIILNRISDTSGAVLREATDDSTYAEAPKQLYTNGVRQKQEKALNGAYSLQVEASIESESLLPQSKEETSQSEDLLAGPSSSSGRSVADPSQSGKYHVEDVGCFVNGSRDLLCRVKDLDTGKEFIVYESGKDGIWTKIKEVSTGRELTLVEFERLLGLSPIVQEARKREKASGVQGITKAQIADVDESERTKRGLLRRIKNIARYVKGVKGMNAKDSSKEESAHETHHRRRSPSIPKDGSPSLQPQRVKVRAYKKSSKEFSDLYKVQEFRAHKGPIWALKFSGDGRYLATGGEDCVVRIWEIQGQCSMEDGEINVLVSDSSDAKFDKTEVVKGSGDLLNNGDRMPRSCSSGRRKNVNAKIIQSPQFFSITEKALRCFHGHTQDVLDLAWSPSQFLVSSSMDKTVRLWHILHDECLKIFSHHDYVTCIEFNPVDDRYFLSGSLDDKLRIWNIIDHQVVDWVDLREMVTAACYTPDGKGVVVGSHKGTCRMYKQTGDKLQIEAHINVLNRKGKKYRGKKITGLQYMPGNPHTLLVTSNDSRIRLYDDLELRCKLKGFRNANSQISASFTSQGDYIVTASEDSRVYVWNTTFDAESTSKGHQKHENKSYEGFSSRNVTIAVPWPGAAPSHGLSQTKEENKSNISNQSGESVSSNEPNDLIDHGSLGSATNLNDLCGDSTDGRIMCACSKLSAPYFCSPSRDWTGNHVAKFTRMPSFVNPSKWSNLWPNDEPHLCRSFTSTQSRSMQDSSFLDSGLLCLSKQNACHLQSPAFEKCFGSCDNVSKVSATWPEEQLPHCLKGMPQPNVFDTIGSARSMAREYLEEPLCVPLPPTYEFVISTATLEGDLRTFQTYKVS